MGAFSNSIIFCVYICLANTSTRCCCHLIIKVELNRIINSPSRHRFCRNQKVMKILPHRRRRCLQFSCATMMNAWQFESWQTLLTPWKKKWKITHLRINSMEIFFSHSNIFLYFKELINFHFFYIFYFVVPQKPFKHPFHLPQAATLSKQITKIIFCLRFFHPPFIHNFSLLACHGLLILSLIMQRRRVWLTIQQHSLIEYLIWFHKYDYTAGGEDERE